MSGSNGFHSNFRSMPITTESGGGEAENSVILIVIHIVTYYCYINLQALWDEEETLLIPIYLCAQKAVRSGSSCSKPD